MEHLKVGDIVWTMQTGYALVTSISDTKNYPIMVDGWASYTTDGMWGCRDKYKSLYLNNPFEDIDDFAIGFAEWCTKYHDKNRNVNGEMLHAKSKYDETYLTKELLETYKKEKGL
jgi:hypothetical protein